MSGLWSYRKAVYTNREQYKQHRNYRDNSGNRGNIGNSECNKIIEIMDGRNFHVNPHTDRFTY